MHARNFALAGVTVALLAASSSLAAETAKEQALDAGARALDAGARALDAGARALDAGARALDADAIAELLVGKTVGFEPAGSDKTFLVHYGADNTVTGRLADGDWADTGFFGITNADTVCLSWHGSDEGRLRCMSVLEDGDGFRKFNPDGGLNGTLVSFTEGKAF